MTRATLELRRERVELASALHQVVASSRPMIDREGQHLTVHLPTEPVYLDADPVRLSQIFGNVLANASKFTSQGGTIALTAYREDDAVVVAIKDNGMGIPPDKLDEVFKMFVQVKTPLEEQRGGLGVGLALVKHLVELHGGTIVAHSEGVGKGSEFVIRLPVLKLAKTSECQRTGAAPVKPSRARRILVVEDNRDSAESLAMLLELSGHETRIAYNGEDALGEAAQYQPDCILLDIGLPKLNGYEACRRIREQAWAKNATIIALTGWGQEEDRSKSMQVGFDAHLVKPVDESALLEVLETRPRQL